MVIHIKQTEGERRLLCLKKHGREGDLGKQQFDHYKPSIEYSDSSETPLNNECGEDLPN